MKTEQKTMEKDKQKHFNTPFPSSKYPETFKALLGTKTARETYFLQRGPCGVETEVWDDGSAGWEPLIMLIGDQRSLPENLLTITVKETDMIPILHWRALTTHFRWWAGCLLVVWKSKPEVFAFNRKHDIKQTDWALIFEVTSFSDYNVVVLNEIISL